MFKKIKPYFLIWLLFPATFFILFSLHLLKENPLFGPDFYTSVKAPKGSTVSILCGKRVLVTIDNTNPGFNKIEYPEKIEHLDSITIQVKGLTEKDTISFLAISLFQYNSVYTLPESQFQFITSDSASKNAENAHLLSFIPSGNAHTVTIHLTNADKWNNPDITWLEIMIFILLFSLLIIALILLNPSKQYLKI
ncbi:MAG TPA: hypothetical protein VK806_02380, partial [Bacteroidia bacterium]|nr:hypothetical protein [Bacteroidia bacterium]